MSKASTYWDKKLEEQAEFYGKEPAQQEAKRTETIYYRPEEGYIVKDSGQRKEFASGMVRDVDTGKTAYSLTLDGPMFERWAAQLTKGAVKYDKRNWMKAEGFEEWERFRESAFRHFIQWYLGQDDEDHAAAVFFNINGAEYVKGATS